MLPGVFLPGQTGRSGRFPVQLAMEMPIIFPAYSGAKPDRPPGSTVSPGGNDRNLLVCRNCPEHGRKNPSYTGILDTYSREVSMFKKILTVVLVLGSSGRNAFCQGCTGAVSCSLRRKAQPIVLRLAETHARIILQPKATSTLRIW